MEKLKAWGPISSLPVDTENPDGALIRVIFLANRNSFGLRPPFLDLPGLAVLKEHVLSATEREGFASSMTPRTGRRVEGGFASSKDWRAFSLREGLWLFVPVSFPPGDACPSGAVGQFSFGTPPGISLAREIPREMNRSSRCF